jgi:eukaryotic-like serine/threonine-protein kinase
MRREGEIIAGKYRVDALLGAGAMGTVYTAHHLLLKEKVAIKFLRRDAIGHSGSVARFVQEARAAVQIQSEHVVRIRDVDLEDGQPYIVMDHLEGCDLAAWLRKKGPLSVDLAVDFIVQTCEAIAKAHDLGIIHRDLKPANIFVVERAGEEPTIKVLDFGISKTTGLVSDTLAPDDEPVSDVVTEEKVTIGSPFYMSPEQMESARDVDERTDIWALGVTLYQLITGRLPFDGANLIQVFSQATSNRPLHLRESSPHVTAGQEAVILKCLQRERERRYRNVRELIAALANLGSSRAAALAMAKPLRAEPALAQRPIRPAVELETGAGTLASRSELGSLAARGPDVAAIRKRGSLALLGMVFVAGVVVMKVLARPGPVAEERAAVADVGSEDRVVPPAPQAPGSGGAARTATGVEIAAITASSVSSGRRDAPPVPPGPAEGARGPRAGVGARTSDTTLAPVAATSTPTASAMAAPSATSLPATPAAATPAATGITSAVSNPIPTVLGGRK